MELASCVNREGVERDTYSTHFQKPRSMICAGRRFKHGRTRTEIQGLWRITGLVESEVIVTVVLYLGVAQQYQKRLGAK